MQIQVSENSVRLIPDSQFEIDALKRLKKCGIKSMKFQDEWEESGWLRLEYNGKEWDR